jgi:DNA-binding winged helix-turn-helix (wHTH) protein
MLWDDFARVGSPMAVGRAARGLTLGQQAFPDALRVALARAGAHAEEAGGVGDLPGAVRDLRPDFVLCARTALGPDAEAAIAPLLETRAGATLALFLVTEERAPPATATGFSEVLGTAQDALGLFLMLRATLRRIRPQALTEVLDFGEIALDQERFVLHLNGAEAPLSKREFCMLGAMLDAPRMVWNREFLNRVVFGPVHRKPGHQFDTWMSLVRRGIRGKTGADPIVAERGMGYALSPWVAGVPGVPARETG